MTVLLALRSTLIAQMAPLLAANGGTLYSIERAPFGASAAPDEIPSVLAEIGARDSSGFLSFADTGGLALTEHARPGASYHFDSFWRFAYIFGSERDNAETGGREALDSATEALWRESMMTQLLTGSPGAPSGPPAYDFDLVRLTGTSAHWRAESFVRVVDFAVLVRSVCEGA